MMMVMMMWWLEWYGRGEALLILDIAATGIEDSHSGEGSPRTACLRHMLPMLPTLQAAVVAGPERHLPPVRTLVISSLPPQSHHHQFCFFFHYLANSVLQLRTHPSQSNGQRWWTRWRSWGLQVVALFLAEAAVQMGNMVAPLHNRFSKLLAARPELDPQVRTCRSSATHSSYTDAHCFPATATDTGTLSVDVNHRYTLPMAVLSLSNHPRI